MEFASAPKESCWGQAYVRAVPEWRPSKEAMCEAVKLKPGLPWRTQDVRDARVVGYLPRRAANREWNQPKRKKCAAVSKAELSWRSEEHLDIRHGDAEFGVCPAGFQSCFVPVFPHCAPLATFWNVMYVLCHYMLGVCDLLFLFLFLFYRSYS